MLERSLLQRDPSNLSLFSVFAFPTDRLTFFPNSMIIRSFAGSSKIAKNLLFLFNFPTFNQRFFKIPTRISKKVDFSWNNIRPITFKRCYRGDRPR